MRITSKGQVTIPLAIRERLGFLAGTEVEFILDGHVVRLVRADNTRAQSRGQRAVRLLRGAATTSVCTEEILALTRAE